MLVPDVKNGNILAADYVLKYLGFKPRADWSGSYADGNPIWGKAEKDKAGVSLTREKVGNLPGMPDVKGMGARDAVYILESRGLKVRLKGRGKVVQQSIPAGHSTRKGMVCELVLS